MDRFILLPSFVLKIFKVKLIKLLRFPIFMVPKQVAHLYDMIKWLFSANFLVLLQKMVIIFALRDFFVKVRIETLFTIVIEALKVEEIGLP